MTSSARTFCALVMSSALITTGMGTAGIAPASAQTQAAAADPNPAYSAAVEAKISRITGDIAARVVADGPERAKVSLQDRMKALAVPGVSIAVINDGKLEWARGFGVTKIGGPPVTTETVFAAASVSKPVAAFGALRLVQDGKINLDIDVNRYLKSWKLPENALTATQKVTLRRLLTHTAGTTTHGFPGYVPGAPYPTLQQILDGEPPANTEAVRVNVTPGTIWRYSGGGYTVAQQMVIDVSGKTFADYQRETIFQPLGMRNSSFEQPLPAARMSQAATPYGVNLQPIAGGARVDPSLMAAGLWTTPSDLALYVMEVQQALAGRSAKVLNKATVTEMLKGGGLEDWGLGPSLGGKPGARWFGHGGDDPGFHNEFMAYENGDGAIVMTNGDNGAQLREEILRTIALEYGWPDRKPPVRKIAQVSLAVLDGITGTYQNGRYSTVRITREGDAVYATTSGSPRSRIYPSDAKTWFYTDADVQLIADTDASGKARSIISRRATYDNPLPRLDDAQTAQLAADLAAKVRDKSQDPRSEAALRRLIDEIGKYAPDYTAMTPAMAGVMRERLANMNTNIKSSGAVRTIRFRGVRPNGGDIYFVGFEREPTEWTVLLAADGRLDSISVGSPPQTPAGDAERMAAFKAQDTDSDGRIDKAGYKRALDDMGFGDQLERLFAQRDVNKDGFITREEFGPQVQ